MPEALPVGYVELDGISGLNELQSQRDSSTSLESK